MVYKDFQGLQLSALGMGTMRLPVIDGDDGQVDEKAVERMVDYAMEQGINYYDTAWGYHNGNSEIVMGKLLKKYERDDFFLATKFPGYDLSNMDKVESIFEEQLKRCQVDYFDFYLLHNVCEMNIDPYLDEQYGIMDYLLKQKAAGRIRHLGFSAHGNYETMERFLLAYGKHMEFCQLQLNYLDWSFQEGKEKVELAEAYNLPVWVMEPLRGGSLATLSDDHCSKLKQLRPEEPMVAWAFRFLQTLPQVKVVLSGMSDFNQMKENLRIFQKEKPLNEREMDVLLQIGNHMVRGITLPCTSCRYCTSHCPQRLNIPSLLQLYNEHCFTGGGFIAPMALMAVPEDKQPKACTGCKNCEAVCPQKIAISEAMADFAVKMNSE